MSDAVKPKILVVEDDDVTQKLVKRFLERSGYEVVVADNGWDGLNLAIGLSARSIDLAAHLGGVVAGFIGAFVLKKTRAAFRKT